MGSKKVRTEEKIFLIIFKPESFKSSAAATAPRIPKWRVRLRTEDRSPEPLTSPLVASTQIIRIWVAAGNRFLLVGFGFDAIITLFSKELC